MDDVIHQRPNPTPIPILSPALHCVAMTVLVYLRSSFGYTFLRPKSIFFACSWAFVLLFIMAWNEPPYWREYRAVCIFGAGAVVLYWLHFAATFFREWLKQGEDDQYPGTPHALRFARALRFPVTSGETIRFFIEPGLVFVVAALLRLAFCERHLSTWLVVVSGCMIGREAINYWTTIRREKVIAETVRKAKQQGDAFSDQPAAPVPKATRKEPVRRQRNTATAEESARETRFSELLRLRKPYTLDKAEENYRALIKLEHPDASEDSPESNARAAELNEAIDFFRNRLR